MSSKEDLLEREKQRIHRYTRVGNYIYEYTIPTQPTSTLGKTIYYQRMEMNRYKETESKHLPLEQVLDEFRGKKVDELRISENPKNPSIDYSIFLENKSIVFVTNQNESMIFFKMFQAPNVLKKEIDFIYNKKTNVLTFQISTPIKHKITEEEMKNIRILTNAEEKKRTIELMERDYETEKETIPSPQSQEIISTFREWEKILTRYGETFHQAIQPSYKERTSPAFLIDLVGFVQRL